MIQDKIGSDIKTAMKAKDSARLGVLRGIKTAFTNELVASKRTPQEKLPDEEATAVMMRLAKQRKDSITQFTDGGRPELAEKEAQELKILEEYLPQMLSKEEILKVVQAKKEAMGISDPSKMGMLIGATMKELKGKAEGSLVKEVVQGLFA